MGMYTELVLKVNLSEGCPVDILEYMFGEGEMPKSLPSHKFFSCPRWDFIGKCSSHYHHPESVNSFPIYDYTKSRSLFSRSDLKNYDDEIELFIDWLQPYIEGERGTCIGWSWYEERISPTLIFKI